MSDINASEEGPRLFKRPTRSQRRTRQVARLIEALKERDAKIEELSADVKDLEQLYQLTEQNLEIYRLKFGRVTA
jgi:predicted RNase H-like nuclease (RuvC/YqgF family)